MAILSSLTLIFWATLMVYWFISAMSAKRHAPGNSAWKRGIVIRVAIVVIVIILVRLGVFGNSSLSFFEQPLWASYGILSGVIGVILCAAGIAFAIWARVYLGRNWGMPMTLQEGHELVISGPYKFVRHPIYTGFLLAALGSAFADGTVWLLIFVVMGIYFVFSAKTEEGIMLKQFPNEYPEYMKRTKMLIPFVL